MYRYFLTLFFLVLLTLGGCNKPENVGVNQKVITKVANGYKLAVPNEIAREVEERQNVKLTLRHPKKEDRGVQGRLSRVSDGLLVETREILYIPSDVANFSIVIHEPNAPAESCGSAEFGIGCFFAAPCVGTEYCLPGPGPGGFVCRCV